LINFETGEKLLEEAGECHGEMLRAFERSSWNMVIRRAQEVVDLSLKAVLKARGVEYPKKHDVGEVFKQACEEQKIEFIDEIDLDEVVRISSYLARERGPAFYMERIYGKEEAEKAKSDATRVIRLAKRLFELLREGNTQN
jgi:HEPN domain-containing protein